MATTFESTYDLADGTGGSSIREDLASLISMVEPEETPFLSMSPRVPVTQTKHEWLEDSLGSATAANAYIEGFTFTERARTPRTRLYNYTQLCAKEFVVSGTARVVNTAGIADEFSYQMMQAVKELKREIEDKLIKNASAIAGDKSTASQFKGVLSSVTTNVNSDSENLGEADFIASIKSSFDEGGRPNTAWVNSTMKSAISAFTTSSTRNINAENGVLTNYVSVYESDFGIIKIVMDQFMNQTDVLIGDQGRIKIGELRPLQEVEIAKTGDADNGLILIELTTEVRNEEALAKLTNKTKA